MKQKMSNSEEIVDLVDSLGVIKKRAVLRSEIDLYPELHLQIIIGIVFDKEGKILVHQRAKNKKTNPGDIDHVCGGVMTAETPEKAFIREAVEETGITPQNVQIVKQGINAYNRYRYLLIGQTEQISGTVDKEEAEWVKFISLSELEEKQKSGEFSFVDEFFEETEKAIQYAKNQKR